MVTRPRLWLKTTSEKGPHLSCVVFTGREVLRAGSTSLRASFTVSPQGEYQWCLAFFVFCWLERFLLLCYVSKSLFLSIAFDVQGSHSSKTVTIVMMSAAQEQKKIGLLDVWNSFIVLCGLFARFCSTF